MQRRIFIKSISLATTGALIAPSILSNMSFANSNLKKAKHVVVVFIGAMRNAETIEMTQGNLMPNLFNKLTDSALQQFGTLYANFNFSEGELGHKNAITTALTGVYNPTQNTKTVFDYCNSVHTKTADVRSAIDVIQQNKPELLVVSLSNSDIAHSNYSAYCSSIKQTDNDIAQLWNTIQNTESYKSETVMIVLPEFGRNFYSNSIVDSNGKGGLDHNDNSARKSFCLVLGPSSVVKQNSIVTEPKETIDILPTIADALGFTDKISIAKTGRSLISDNVS